MAKICHPVDMANLELRVEDIRKQAIWELEIERFEAAVEREKRILRMKKAWFPWRLRLININQVRGNK